MTFEIDQILIIPILIICLYKFITEKKNNNYNNYNKKVTSYERIGLISEYEDLNSTIADNEDAWGDYV